MPTSPSCVIGWSVGLEVLGERVLHSASDGCNISAGGVAYLAGVERLFDPREALRDLLERLLER